MKKKAFAILTLCISLFAAVALVGCGGSGGATGSNGMKRMKWSWATCWSPKRSRT